MEIFKSEVDGNLTLTLKGRLDTITAPQLENELGNLADLKSLVIDCEDLEYISSAGLRLILKIYKALKDKGDFRLIHVAPLVKEVFDITGFSDVMNLETKQL